MITFTRAILTTILLSTAVKASETIYPTDRTRSTPARSLRQPAAKAAAKDPCGMWKEEDPKKTVGPIVAEIIDLETEGNLAQAKEALGWRRKIKIAYGKECYEYLQDHGMGRSTITGE
jgi:hypothetical protein